MKFYLSLLFCLSTLYLSAQNINNLKIEQKGGELSIQYNLTSTDNIPFKINVLYSADKNNWKLADKVYGDVGDSIYMGNSKKAILWIDHIENIQSKLFFKISAEYYAVDEKNEGNLKDKTGYTYNWVRYGKTKWMTQNLKASQSDPDCGGYYTNSNARNACPDGWNLPSDENWMDLEIQFGVSNDKVKEHGLREINLIELKNSGFVVEECSYKTSFYPNQKALAFWTGTENKMLYTGYSDKYLARIIRLDENKISKELRKKSEELNVRCVQGATYLAKIEAIAEKDINLNSTRGIVNHPYTGEKLEWQHFANNIWLKKDILGSYLYKELEGKCPAGWRLPGKEEWEGLYKEFKPSVKFENHKEILSERLSTSGAWSISLSNNDYWRNTNYYTYNTFWILKTDKEVSEKLLPFPTNDKGTAGWEDKQTNEKAKLRCVLDNEDFLTKRKSLKAGSFKDTRDNKEYGSIEIENITWMSENLSYDMGENSMCRANIKKDCELFGHMYNTKVAEGGCPTGWRLPTSDEWKYLLINKAANNHKILYPFGGTGFNLLLGGEVIYDEENKTDTYSAEYLYKDGDKVGFYYINSNGKVEKNEKAKKKDFYYIRCIKEVNDRF